MHARTLLESWNTSQCFVYSFSVKSGRRSIYEFLCVTAFMRFKNANREPGRTFRQFIFAKTFFASFVEIRVDCSVTEKTKLLFTAKLSWDINWIFVLFFLQIQQKQLTPFELLLNEWAATQLNSRI